MSEHSNGPWRLADEDEVYGRLVRAPDGLVIAALCDGDGADASLVAAAPELLEALEALMTHTLRVGSIGEYCRDCDALIRPGHGQSQPAEHHRRACAVGEAGALIERVRGR